MGGGNAQKSAISRAKNAAKAASAGKGSRLKDNAAALSIICQVCRSTFLCTSTRPKLEEHVASKHAKGGSFEGCFPGFAG